MDGISSKVLYLGYLLLIALVDFVVTGTIGYLVSANYICPTKCTGLSSAMMVKIIAEWCHISQSTYYFLRKMYAQIRVD